MGDVNQKLYLKKVLPSTEGPILEIGSKDHGNTVDFRSEFPGAPYLGIDMESGKNVDAVVDLTKIPMPDFLPQSHFSLVICCSVLEHVRRPWLMAENITALLRPGGMAFVSVPWVWRYHPYPDDYFRFSWRGIMEIFPELEWRHPAYSTNVEGEIFRIDMDAPGLDDRMAVHLKVGDNGNRKYLPYLMVQMIGRKPRPSSGPAPSPAHQP